MTQPLEPAGDDFAAAAACKLSFGKYRGHTLDEVAETDEGLLYLDWLVGQPWLKPEARRALETYLGNPVITEEVMRCLRKPKHQGVRHWPLR